MTRVKICCISSLEEANIAVAHGADALGFVSEMPSGPGVIDDAMIAEIAAAVPPAVSTFLLTSRTDADGIIAHAETCGTDTLQLVDRVSPDTHATIRRELPHTRIVQVVHVQDASAHDDARAVAPYVDMLLLDSGRPDAERRELGGTGRTHDWAISREIVASAVIPVYLAGGLTAENVGTAVRSVAPHGVDLCSGLRTDGNLDTAKVGRFMSAVRAAATP